MITRQFGIPVTSPGAILRREKDLGTPLGKKTAEVLQSGGLVSDKIIIELIEDWLRLHGGHGFVFDGFPRTLRQAESLNFDSSAIAYRFRFSDLARGVGTDCARSHCRPAPMRRMRLYYQLIQRAVLRTCRMPLLRRSISTSERRRSDACCKLACKSSAPRPNRWHLFMEKCRSCIGSTATAIARQSLAIFRD